MIEFKNYYFETTYEEGNIQISGLPLPNPDGQPYRFIDCDIHPRLWSCCKEIYRNSEFINTYLGWQA